MHDFATASHTASQSSYSQLNIHIFIHTFGFEDTLSYDVSPENVLGNVLDETVLGTYQHEA